MLQKNKHKVVADKVAELFLRTGVEDNSEESESDEVPRVTDFDSAEYELPDSRSTAFRKKNIKLLSDQNDRYRGKIVTRKDVDDSDSDHSAVLNVEKFDYSSPNTSENESIETENAAEDEDSETENEMEADLLAETNSKAEVQKGICVQNQLRIWEKLLELRIHSQKILNKGNQLPTPVELQPLAENRELQHAVSETTANLGTLLKTLLYLKNSLYCQFSESKSALTNHLKRPLPLNELGDEQPPFKRIADHLSQQFIEFQPYRNAVLLKWDDRTKLLTPGSGTKKKTANEEFDVVRKIENTLINRSALIEKSRFLKCSNISSACSEEQNVNIYDDSDFYHQQLRELIEYKANSSTNMSEVTKQYLELQKLRQNMKKNVDTRASKGRKLRYIVHNKLVNFMASNDTSSCTDESKNDLYKSLFAS